VVGSSGWRPPPGLDAERLTRPAATFAIKDGHGLPPAISMVLGALGCNYDTHNMFFRTYRRKRHTSPEPSVFGTSD
jgi:hypothetical protein